MGNSHEIFHGATRHGFSTIYENNTEDGYPPLPLSVGAWVKSPVVTCTLKNAAPYPCSAHTGISFADRRGVATHWSWTKLREGVVILTQNDIAYDSSAPPPHTNRLTSTEVEPHKLWVGWHPFTSLLALVTYIWMTEQTPNPSQSTEIRALHLTLPWSPPTSEQQQSGVKQTSGQTLVTTLTVTQLPIYQGRQELFNFLLGSTTRKLQQLSPFCA